MCYNRDIVRCDLIRTDMSKSIDEIDETYIDWREKNDRVEPPDDYFKWVDEFTNDLVKLAKIGVVGEVVTKGEERHCTTFVLEGGEVKEYYSDVGFPDEPDKVHKEVKQTGRLYFEVDGDRVKLYMKDDVEPFETIGMDDLLEKAGFFFVGVEAKRAKKEEKYKVELTGHTRHFTVTDEKGNVFLATEFYDKNSKSTDWGIYKPSKAYKPYNEGHKIDEQHRKEIIKAVLDSERD